MLIPGEAANDNRMEGAEQQGLAAEQAAVGES